MKRFKKQIITALIEKYKFEMEKCFEKWKQECSYTEENRLRNQVLGNIITSQNNSIKRHAINQFKYQCRQNRITEKLNILAMQRWKKKLIFKVFKLIRVSTFTPHLSIEKK